MVDQSLLLGSLYKSFPALVVWILALVLSLILSRRTSTKLARFLIVGSSLLIASTFLSIWEPAITAFLIARYGMHDTATTIIVSGVNLILGLVSLVGIICLFYAIWKKFNEKIGISTDN